MNNQQQNYIHLFFLIVFFPKTCLIFSFPSNFYSQSEDESSENIKKIKETREIWSVVGALVAYETLEMIHFSHLIAIGKYQKKEEKERRKEMGKCDYVHTRAV